MKKSYFQLWVVTLLLVGGCTKNVENPLSSLKEKRLHSLSLYLYPSTIRMVNMGNDTTFYKATKDIEKVHFLSIDLGVEKNDSIYNAWFEKQNLASWDELFQASSDGNLYAIYAAPEAEDQFFGYMKSANNVNLLYAEGELDLNSLMQLSKSDLNLGPVSSFLDNKDKIKKRREVSKKVREEQLKLQQEEDSIKNLPKEVR